MMTARLVVLISGRGSNLKAIIDQLPSLDAKIEAVISNNPDAPGLALASTVGAKSHSIPHQEYPNRESFDTAMIEVIDTYQPDLVILAGFMRILSAGFVHHYADKLLNIHPSLLPKHKGTNTHAKAIAAGDSVHGATVHFVSPELDSGPIIMQAQVPIKPEDTPETLAAKVLIEEHQLYPAAIKKVLDAQKGTRVPTQGRN